MRIHSYFMQADAAAQRDECTWKTRTAQAELQQALQSHRLDQLTAQLATAEAAAASKQKAAELWAGQCSDARQQLADAQAGQQAAVADQQRAEEEVARWQQQARRLQAEADALREAAAVNLHEMSNMCRLMQTVHTCIVGHPSGSAVEIKVGPPCQVQALQSMEQALQRVLTANEQAAKQLAAGKLSLDPAGQRGIHRGTSRATASRCEPEAGVQRRVMPAMDEPQQVLASESVSPQPSRPVKHPSCESPVLPAATDAVGHLDPGAGMHDDWLAASPWQQPESAPVQTSGRAGAGGSLSAVVAALERELAGLDLQHAGAGEEGRGPAPHWLVKWVLLGVGVDGPLSLVLIQSCCARLDLTAELLRASVELGSTPAHAPGHRSRSVASKQGQLAAEAKQVRAQMRVKGQQLQQLRAFLRARPGT